jgi:tRNA G18 (ribose-2'-O)-methylase SpoU
MNCLLYAPEYRPNLSSMIRTAEFFGLQKIFIYDQNALMQPPTNKKGRADMAHLAKVWTAGAIDFIEIVEVTDPLEFLQQYEGRKIATVVNEAAAHLDDFQFEPQDLLIFGSEREGLPPEIVAATDKAIYLPSSGKTDCLNVAVTFGIVLHQALKFGQQAK